MSSTVAAGSGSGSDTKLSTTKKLSDPEFVREADPERTREEYELAGRRWKSCIEVRGRHHAPAHPSTSLSGLRASSNRCRSIRHTLAARKTFPADRSFRTVFYDPTPWRAVSSTTDSRLADIANRISLLTEEQRRTADMLQSLLYMQAYEDREEVEYVKDSSGNYWRVVAPWE